MVKAASLAEPDPEERSHWASLASHSLWQHIVNPSSVEENARTNLLTQDVKLNERDPPPLHKKMVKCLTKYGVSFETVHPSNEIKEDMPLWHHPGKIPGKRQENNGRKAKCLRKKHAVKKVRDALDMIRRLDDPQHTRSEVCGCNACDVDRTVRRCLNPHACVAAAAARLKQIRPKWIPNTNEAPEPTPTTADTTEEGDFKPPAGITTLAQGLRAMTRRTDEPKERENPPVRWRAETIPPPAEVEIFIAGVVHAPVSQTACAAAGIFIEDGSTRDTGKCIPIAGEQSPYAAELFAALEATKMTHRDTVLTITS
ncbi:hypothetical protein DFH07DRAFT_741115, partial [Mycena maculata]